MSATRWIGRKPPVSFWPKDKWYNETDQKEYVVNIERQVWVSEDSEIPFPPKARLMNGR